MRPFRDNKWSPQIPLVIPVCVQRSSQTLQRQLRKDKEEQGFSSRVCPRVCKRREFGKGVFGRGEPTSPWKRREWLGAGLYNGAGQDGLGHNAGTGESQHRMAPQTGPSEKGTGEIPTFPQLFTWEEIGIHNGRGQGREQWLVIDRKVYDVSKFSERHPGGKKVISHYAGQDATVRAGKAVLEGGSPAGNAVLGWSLPCFGQRAGWESSTMTLGCRA